MTSRRFFLGLIGFLLVPVIAVACLWDYDTLKQERSRFPSSLELITGKFLRHSKEFYQWRIEDRLKRLETEPNNLALYDDLAAAYDKTGQQDKAIEVMLQKEKLQPGLYETYANLGTFYFHSGKFDQGLPVIDKALKINPDAHFGRELYQKLLVEYVQSKRQIGKSSPPLGEGLGSTPERKAHNFSLFVASQLNPNANGLKLEELQAAVKGILGMMRFGHHDSPILLEALGDLLTTNPIDRPSLEEDSKRLAARAYLKASYEVNNDSARKKYREFAENTLGFQTNDPKRHDQLRLEELEEQFKKELTDANDWYAKLKEQEISWIREGKNPEVEFDKLYTEDPIVPDEPSDAFTRPTGGVKWSDIEKPLFIGLLILFILSPIIFTQLLRKIIRGRQGKQTT